jgi:hypothetical protein
MCINDIYDNDCNERSQTKKEKMIVNYFYSILIFKLKMKKLSKRK